MSHFSNGRGISRRQFLVLAAASAAAATLPVRPAHAAEEIVFATWGGSWEDAMRRAWFEPFTEKTGISVRTATGNTYGRIQAMVQSGRTEWDVVEVEPDFLPMAKENDLLSPIDYSIVDASGVRDENLVHDLMIPQVLFGYSMTYNTGLPEVPTTWQDIWDVENFPGTRTFQSDVGAGILEAALLADGVQPDELYPLDLDRAFAKLDEIRRHINLYETVTQGEQYMSDGQAALGLIPDGRALNVQSSGAPVEVAFDLSLLTWSSMVVPKGAPNRDAAMRFLAYTLTPEAQAAIAHEYTYGPVVPAAFDMISDERAKTLSGGPHMENAVVKNEQWWGENYERASERLQTWRLG